MNYYIFCREGKETIRDNNNIAELYLQAKYGESNVYIA